MKKVCLTFYSMSIIFTVSALASDKCPELTGEFICPANSAYGASKEYKVIVAKGAESSEFRFIYENGTQASLVASGEVEDINGTLVRHRCTENALVTEYLQRKNRDLIVTKWSRQQIDENGNYKVVVTGDRVSLLCSRKK